MRLPPPSFAHLLRLSDDTGLLEHARLLTPRREHGYTTDDVARGLIAVCREKTLSPELVRLAHIYLAFLEHARQPGGGYHNRLSYDRRWSDVSGSEDAHGRALWALGVVGACAPERLVRATAASAFRLSSMPAGDWPRPYAFTVLGAAAMLRADPDDEVASAMLKEAVDRIPRPGRGEWLWPEPRLAYDNARLPEALLAAGRAEADEATIADGLRLLDWLVGTQTRQGHYSFTPAGGWGPGEPRPGFDQQPVEAAATADACALAWEITGDETWAERVVVAGRWLMGDNDSAVALYDPASGACRDGLQHEGVNENSGAESTVSAILVLQQARRVQLNAAGANVTREVAE